MHTIIDKHGFGRISLPRQFILVTAGILVVCMVIFGTWVGHQIERNAVSRAASATAFYVESILAAQLHDWQRGTPLAPALHDAFDDIFVAGPLRDNVVSFKLWAEDGRMVYSTVAAREGRRYPVSEHLAAALSGELQADVTDLAADDELIERSHGERLLEIYVPVRDAAGDVIAVAEFYHPMNNIQREIRVSQLESWALVFGGAAAIFLVLYSLMQRANRTIVDQQRGLREQLATLRATLAENEAMRERISAAGAQTTALNEQMLRRLAADLHDGPAQDLAFALMRFDELAQTACGEARDLAPIRKALNHSLDELRAICAGLGVPGITGLSLAETVQRAVRDVGRRMNLNVRTDIDAGLGAASLAVKLTTYRMVQESLTNCWRHAARDGVAVRARRSPDGRQVIVEISDHGPGFDPSAIESSSRLGLAFMRERVRLLGGQFEIRSAPNTGTTVCAWMPLDNEEDSND
ncbi:MAG: sensor histidine kinase [Gammaproteobacteria bacterium]|nr:sensor histidine kinase [Gammaproteobacteria bacterium]MBU1414658.1 sensor histidine kinase [Gammaproteobacteria bacterium]